MAPGPYIALPSAPQLCPGWRSYRFPARRLTLAAFALPTGGPTNGEYDDGDLTGKDVRVYVVDSGVQGSHVDFGGRVVSGHTVRALHTPSVPVPLC